MLKANSVRTCLVALALAVAFTASSLADHAWTNQYGQPYHWARTTSTFTLKVGDNVSGVWENFAVNNGDTNLERTIADWSQSSVMDVVKVAGSTRPRQCRPTNGRIEVCNDNYGFNGWLGIAQIWITGGVHITQGTAKMNDSYFKTAPYNTYSWRQLVMCQEVGHTFGLGHQDEDFSTDLTSSCMDYTNNPASNEHPDFHDFALLEEIYAHLDSTTTVAATVPSDTPPAMAQLNFDSPGQWGRLVSSSANGRSQEFELDFGNGNKVLTHVFWADPDNDRRR